MTSQDRAKKLLKTRFKDIKGINTFLDRLANNEPVLSGKWNFDTDAWLNKLEGKTCEEKRG